MARHPGASFTVNHPHEAVPKSTNDRLSLPCHDPPFFKTFISKGLPGGNILPMCTRFANYEICNDVLYAFSISLKISSRLFERIQQVGLFLNILIKMFNVF